MSPLLLHHTQDIPNVHWKGEESTDTDGGVIGPTPPECSVVGFSWGVQIGFIVGEFNITGEPNFPFDTTPIFAGFDWWEGGADGMSHVFVTFGYAGGAADCFWSFGGCDPLGATSHAECFVGTGDPATNGTATSPPTTTGRDDYEKVESGSTFGGYDWP